jgi:alkylhydroperoxidase family enzyme
VRIEIPEGLAPEIHIQTGIGSPALRQAMVQQSVVLFHNDSTITPREREGARYYLTFRYDCERCNDFRVARDLHGYDGEPIEDAFYDNIADYATNPLYTVRERLMIETVDRFLEDFMGVAKDDDLWCRLRSAFSEEEVMDVLLISAFIDTSVKLRDILLGTDRTCPVPQS